MYHFIFQKKSCYQKWNKIYMKLYELIPTMQKEVHYIKCQII